MFNLDSALGIEIVNDTLFFTVVKKRYQGYSVQGSMVLRNYADMPEPELYGRVQHFISQHPFNRDNVILGVPRDLVILRYITLPKEVEENLDQVAQLQFSKYEPNEEVESCLEYSVVERNEVTGRIRVRVSMVGRDMIDRYLNLLSSWNLYPYSIRISSAGLMYAAVVHRDGFPEKDPILIYRVSAEKVEAIMVLEGQEFHSEVFFTKPGQAITAEWIMIETTSFVSRLSRKVSRLSKVYLSGEVPPELFSEISSRLGDVEYFADGFNTAELNVKKAELEDKLVSIGMALSGLEKSGRRSLNLIPSARRLIGGTPSLAATAVLVFLLIVVGISWSTQGYFRQKILLEQIEQQMQVMQKNVDEVFQLRGDVQVKQAEVELLRNLMSNRQATLLILQDLSSRVPEDAYFRTFKISGNDIEIQGNGNRASSLVPIIADSPYLNAVKINWIRADSRDEGKERFSFSATIEGTEGDAE